MGSDALRYLGQLSDSAAGSGRSSKGTVNVVHRARATCILLSATERVGKWSEQPTSWAAWPVMCSHVPGSAAQAMQ